MHLCLRNVNRKKMLVFFHFVCICSLLLMYLYILCTSLHEYMQAGDLKQTHRGLWSVNVHLRREMSIIASASQKSRASAENFHSSNWLFTHRFQSWSKRKMIYFSRIKPRVDASGKNSLFITSYSILNLNDLISKFSLNVYKTCLFHKLA